MFAKQFVSCLVWDLFAIGFVSFLVGGYVCQWVCLSVGSYVVSGVVCQLGVMFGIGFVYLWVCACTSVQVLIPSATLNS